MRDQETWERALALDRTDPLARFRDAFLVGDPEGVYLDGNSLGRLPHRSREVLQQATDEAWGVDLVRSWSPTPTGGDWFGLPRRVGDAIGRLVGAGPGRVAVCDSTSVNLFKLASAAMLARPGRHRIVSDRLNFPSDLYVLQGVAAANGGTLELAPAAAARDDVAAAVATLDPEPGVEPEVEPEGQPDVEPDVEPDLDALDALIDASTALVSLSMVSFKSGYLYDVPAITERAHRAGALVLWDLSHAAGAVPVELDAWGVDLAVGCTYKYLNGGPGAPAFLYVNDALRTSLRSPIQGWFGQSEPFGFGLDYQPADGIERFLAGTPPVLSTLPILPGVEMLLEAGMPALRAKSLALASFLLEAYDARLRALGFSLGSPRSDQRRGSHVSFRHPEARRISRALRLRGVVPDFREPDNLRLGLAPLYTSFAELARAVDAIVEVVTSAEHESLGHAQTTVT